MQDLTVTIMSERLEKEVELEDDHRQPSTINVESFVDEQEWRLYHEVETFQGVVNKFYEGGATEMCAYPSFSCRTHASRRPGFYITNIFVVMVNVSFPYADSLSRELIVCCFSNTGNKSFNFPHTNSHFPQHRFYLFPSHLRGSVLIQLGA